MPNKPKQNPPHVSPEALFASRMAITMGAFPQLAVEHIQGAGLPWESIKKIAELALQLRHPFWR
jgi:hypothetical protein